MKIIKYNLIVGVVLSCLFIPAWTSSALAEDDNKSGAVWVLDLKDGNIADVVKVSVDGNIEFSRKGGFKRAKDLEIDPRDGSIWVTDTGNNQIVKLSSDGKTELARVGSLDRPLHACVSPTDGVLWIADEGRYEVLKVSSGGRKELLKLTGFTKPHDIEASLYDGSVWLLDSEGGRVIKFSSSGEVLGQVDGLGSLRHFAISPFDGSCWVVKTDSGIVKISPDGKKVLADTPDLVGFELSVNPIDGSCWVVDREGRKLYNMASDGKTQLLEFNNSFKTPIAISSINPSDGSFWVGDSGRGEVIKISGTGKELTKISGFLIPIQIIEIE